MSYGVVGTWAGSSAPVYPIEDVQRRLLREPHAWLGQVVRVRAIARVCIVPMSGPGSPCRERHPVLAAIAGADGAAALPLLPAAGPSPIVAFALRILARVRLAPELQRARWGVMSVYTVQLRSVACVADLPPPCSGAVMLGVTSGVL